MSGRFARYFSTLLHYPFCLYGWKLQMKVETRVVDAKLCASRKIKLFNNQLFAASNRKMSYSMLNLFTNNCYSPFLGFELKIASLQKTHAHSAKISVEMRRSCIFPLSEMLSKKHRRRSRTSVDSKPGFVTFDRLDWMLCCYLCLRCQGICLGFHSSNWIPCERQWVGKNGGN